MRVLMPEMSKSSWSDNGYSVTPMIRGAAVTPRSTMDPYASVYVTGHGPPISPKITTEHADREVWFYGNAVG